MSDGKASLLSEDVTRRGFVVTSLAAGFALATQPVSAQTITTDTEGLTAGEVKIPVTDGDIPAYRAMPADRRTVPDGAGRARNLRSSRAHQGYLPTAGQAGLPGRGPEMYARQGDVSKIKDFREIITKVVSKVPDAQVMSDLDATVAWAKATGKADTAKLAITGFCWGGRIVWLYSAHNPNLKAGVAWYGRLVEDADELHPKHPIDVVASLNAPVLGLYGEADGSIPVASVEKMRGP